MAKSVPMLTTIDNPFNPFTQYDEWFQFDVEHGYNTCGLLDRFTNASNELSDSRNLEAIETAIDEICKLFCLQYRKVYRTTPDS